MTQLRLVVNTRLDRSAAERAARQTLPEAGLGEAEAAITAWPRYEPTPLVELPALARRLGIGRLLVKDEAGRFGLGSFKALGGAYAVYRLVAGAAPRWRNVTVACATDGNHGRSVAWGAQQVGCRCVIYLHEGVSAAREDAIRRLGAETRRAGATYDASAALCAQAAAREGWTIVSDTDPEGRGAGTVADIMQGYRVLALEVERQLPDAAAPTHVFLQVGCGGFAAAIAGHLLARLSVRAPVMVAVEPDDAACLAASVESGRPVKFEGDLDTVMAGLSVGEVSQPAWTILSRGVEAVAVVPDDAAVLAMRALAGGAGADPPIVSGESGAAGLAGLMAVAHGSAARRALALEASSTVLVINTEGATDEEIYERLIGRPPGAVGSPVSPPTQDSQGAIR